MACQATFTALGKSVQSIIVAVVRKFGLLLPFIYIMPLFAETMEGKTMAVYTAEPISDVLAVTFTAILFFFQFKKTLKEMDHKLPSHKEA